MPGLYSPYIQIPLKWNERLFLDSCRYNLDLFAAKGIKYFDSNMFVIVTQAMFAMEDQQNTQEPGGKTNH